MKMAVGVPGQLQGRPCVAARVAGAKVGAPLWIARGAGIFIGGHGDFTEPSGFSVPLRVPCVSVVYKALEFFSKDPRGCAGGGSVGQWKLPGATVFLNFTEPP